MTATLPEGLAKALGNSRHTLVLTGAGISAESGVPTFRDAQSGLWSKYDSQDLATPEAFDRDPALIWRWYRWRRELVAAAHPNAGHRALAALGQTLPRLSLITQNVDGLHQLAGSQDVIEFHGNLFSDRCSAGCGEQSQATDDAGLPRCQGCNALLRPGVVWFGESIPAAALDAAQTACNDCDLFLSIGTSSLVWPAAGFAEAVSARGVPVAEINPDDTPLSAHCDYRIREAAGTALPKLLDCIARTEDV